MLQRPITTPDEACDPVDLRGEADRALALAVHRREPDAFERFVKRHERLLLAIARARLGSPEDAQEVVQDAFVRAHRALTRQYDEGRVAALAVAPWLGRIVRNLAANKRRGKRREVEVPMPPLAEERFADDEAARPGAAVLQSERAARVSRALGALPPATRELVVLRFVEEVPYCEIAAALATTEATLRGRVFRALKTLREVLEPLPGDRP